MIILDSLQALNFLNTILPVVDKDLGSKSLITSQIAHYQLLLNDIDGCKKSLLSSKECIEGQAELHYQIQANLYRFSFALDKVKWISLLYILHFDGILFSSLYLTLDFI